ncbi:MAG TPA: IS3 family transposase, partial [Candidatus Coprousia avicola]|nr:IS3 family transposase [Candidatus Coprousia avicola]
MHDRETVELFLLARGDGMSVREAAALAGVAGRTAEGWAAGRLPRSYTGEPWGSGRIARKGGSAGGGADMDDIRSLYGPAEEGPLAGMTPDQIENLLLRAVLDDLKGGGSHPASMPMRSRCGLASRLRLATGLPMSAITRFLEIPRSTWYYHRARLGLDRLAWLRPFVREAFALCGRRGYRAVHATLRAAGVRVSEKVVRRVMREEGLSARRPRRRAYSSYAGEPAPAPPNLPLRADGTHDFSAAAPNRLWATDITEFRLPGGAGKCYLSAVVDCFDGRPVSWSIGPSPAAELANSSLRAACATLSPGERPVVHSDRGGHYRWKGWVRICRANRLVRSMSRKG